MYHLLPRSDLKKDSKEMNLYMMVPKDSVQMPTVTSQDKLLEFQC